MQRRGKVNRRHTGLKGEGASVPEEVARMRARAREIATAVSLALMVIALWAAPRNAHAGASEGVSFMIANQAADGGFHEPGRGDKGQDATTAWCVMALSAAGKDPREIRKNGRSPLDFLATQSGNWHSVTDYERTLLAVAAAGEDPRSFGGVDLLEKVRSYQGAGGNIGDAVNSNAFGILALKAAGAEIPEGAVQWHRGAQNPDGGWGNSKGAASNPDMTAASIMALRAAGVEPGDPAISSALAYLHAVQNPDGGFSFQPGSSDTAATSWCAQAIIAVGQDPGGGAWSRGGNTPLSFVRSMQGPDGSFSWMQGREMNPVWTTAYAVCALAGKPFPVASYRQVRNPTDGGEAVAGDSGGEGNDRDNANEAGEEEAAQSMGEGFAEGGTAQEGEAIQEEKARALREIESLEKEHRAGEGETVKDEGDGRGGIAIPLLIAAVLAALLSSIAWWMCRRRPWRREDASER